MLTSPCSNLCSQQPLDDAKQDISVQAALMSLIKDDDLQVRVPPAEETDMWCVQELCQVQLVPP